MPPSFCPPSPPPTSPSCALFDVYPLPSAATVWNCTPPVVCDEISDTLNSPGPKTAAPLGSCLPTIFGWSKSRPPSLDVIAYTTSRLEPPSGVGVDEQQR